MAEGNEISCTIERAQELTGYTRQQLYQAINAGRLTTWKVGRRRMTSPQYLRAMVEADQLASNGKGRAAA